MTNSLAMSKRYEEFIKGLDFTKDNEYLLYHSVSTDKGLFTAGPCLIIGPHTTPDDVHVHFELGLARLRELPSSSSFKEVNFIELKYRETVTPPKPNLFRMPGPAKLISELPDQIADIRLLRDIPLSADPNKWGKVILSGQETEIIVIDKKYSQLIIMHKIFEGISVISYQVTQDHKQRLYKIQLERLHRYMDAILYQDGSPVKITHGKISEYFEKNYQQDE